MSAAPTVQQLLAALEKWHVPFTGLPGWETHNRAGHGAWGDMHGFVNHHSASKADGRSYALSTLYQGRSDLPGPLCNFGLDRSGMVWGVGWGRANHAGSARPAFLAALLADKVPPLPTTTAGETDDANAFTYGCEVMNDGLGEPYPPDQIESLVRLNCALLDLHHWTEASSVQHYEVTRRKVDMAPIAGKTAGPFLRVEVAKALHAGPDAYHYPGSTRWASLEPVQQPHQSTPSAPAPVAPSPTPQEDDVDPIVLFRKDGSLAAYKDCGTARRWVSGTERDALEAAGYKVPVAVLPDADAFWSLPVIGPER